MKTMSQMNISTLRSPRMNRRTIVAKASFSDDDDAITPCSSPPPEPQDAVVLEQQQQPQQQFSFGPTAKKINTSHSNSAASSRKTSTSHPWHFDPTEGEEMDDVHLWQRMLDIQKTFHCYNSARMSAALLELEMGVDPGHLARKFFLLRSLRALALRIFSSRPHVTSVADPHNLLIASRSCLDLMNESISAMSEEERQRLSEWLQANPSTKKRRSALWKRSPVF